MQGVPAVACVHNCRTFGFLQAFLGGRGSSESWAVSISRQSDPINVRVMTRLISSSPAGEFQEGSGGEVSAVN